MKKEPGDREQLLGELAELRRRVRELEDLLKEELRTKDGGLGQLPSFEAFIDAIPAAVFVKDARGRYLGCNRAFESAFGISRQEMVGKTAHDVAPADLAGVYAEADARTLREAGIYRYETSVQNAHGVRHKVIFQKSLLSDSTGRTVGIVGLAVDVTEQKNAEEGLREAEKKFRDVAEKSLAGIYVVQDGLFKYVNPRFAEIHGYTREELQAMGPADVVVPDDLPVVRENLRKRVEGEAEALHFEFGIITKAGESRIVEVYGSRTVYEGEPAVIGTLLDITERKKNEEALRSHKEHLEELVRERTMALEKEIAERRRTEKALRESEEKYRAIFENATEGVFQSTPEGRFLSVNPAFASIFGYDSPEEVLSEVTDAGHQLYSNPADREKVLGILEREGKVEGYETEVYRKDGEKIWISINAHAVRDANGLTVKYEGTNQDITVRKRTEASLRESEERYRIAIESSNDGVSLIRKGRHIFVNRKFLEIFGYDEPDEVIGKPPAMTVHPDDREMVNKFNMRRLSGKPAPSRYEFKGIRKDGSVVFIEVSATATPYLGTLVSLAYLRDVTGRKEMEERLRVMSVADELTGLYNRRGFLSLCQKQMKLAERSKTVVALLFIDLDGMKRINDTLGHRKGDEALMEVAAILHDTFRETDIMGRIGGDEFAVLLIDAGEETAEEIRRRLHQSVCRHNESRRKEYDISISVGVAFSGPGHSYTFEGLMAKADTLMYEEKALKETCR